MQLSMKVKLYPNKTMAKVLDNSCDYRRYCWNQGLELWNDLYEQRVEIVPASLRKNHNWLLKIKQLCFQKKKKNYWTCFHHRLIALFKIC